VRHDLAVAEREYERFLRTPEPELEQEAMASGRLYEVIGRDTRRLVTRAEIRRAPFRYICHLEYGGRNWCTGTLIGPRTVLTAGHCITGIDPTRMRVIPGRHGTWEPLPATFATRRILPRGYRPLTRTDYGILRLRDAIGTTVGYWTRLHSVGTVVTDPIGTSISAAPLPLPAGRLRVNVSGYPGDKCFRTGRPPRRVCGTHQFRAYDESVRVRDGILHYRNDTAIRMSGCPVWVRRHASMGGRVMVAIHLGGDDPTLRGRANRGVRISEEIINFIRRNMV
jgi:glutamyl endopeptidase